jgi:hypothetical protein
MINGSKGPVRGCVGKNGQARVKIGRYKLLTGRVILLLSSLIIFSLSKLPISGLSSLASDRLSSNKHAYKINSQVSLLAERAWYGIRHVPMEDIQTVSDNMGGSVIEIVVRPQSADEINAMLDQVEATGYRVVLNIYTHTTSTRRPWEWNASGWVFSESTIEMLQGIADHPALFAIYALHEPLDEGEGYVSVEQQRELYLLLKEYADGLPVFTDIGGLKVWEDRGVDLSDGICDYCCTFPTHFRSDWTSEQCIAETLSRIDGDLDTQQRLMPNSQIVFLINTYAYDDYRVPFRLPTPGELTIVREYICALRQPMMYYPWVYDGYDSTLKDAPQLWPIIAEGCTYSSYLPLLMAHSD